MSIMNKVWIEIQSNIT